MVEQHTEGSGGFCSACLLSIDIVKSLVGEYAYSEKGHSDVGDGGTQSTLGVDDEKSQYH